MSTRSTAANMVLIDTAMRDDVTFETMDDVRAEVDRVDTAIISLMARRFHCMDAAARIKSTREAVRDEDRKAEVLSHVKRLAAETGVPVPLVAAMWEMLVETSISYELEKWDQLRG